MKVNGTILCQRFVSPQYRAITLTPTFTLRSSILQEARNFHVRPLTSTFISHPRPLSTATTPSPPSPTSPTAPSYPSNPNRKPKPDPITRSIDQITRLKPAPDLSAKITRIWRLSECLQQITISQKGRLNTVSAEATKDQAEAIRLVKQRLELDEKLEQRVALAGKGGSGAVATREGEGPRWTKEQRSEFRKALRQHNVFSVVMQGQLYLIIGCVILGTWWAIQNLFAGDEPDDID